MVANRRVDYQRLCEELGNSRDEETRSEIKSSIIELVIEDKDYARGFIEDSLRRALKYISPTVGKDEGRPFAIVAEVILQKPDEPVVLVGASFRPKVEDDVHENILFLGEEIYGLAAMRGFDWLIGRLAVNGIVVPRP